MTPAVTKMVLALTLATLSCAPAPVPPSVAPVATPTAPGAVVTLAHDFSAFRERFERDRKRPRLVVLLSPT